MAGQYIPLLDAPMPYSPFYFDDKTFRYFPYTEDIAMTRGLRAMTIEEMREHNLTFDKNAKHTAALIVRLPADLDKMTKSQMATFCREKNLMKSFNIARPHEELRHMIRVAVASRRKAAITSGDMSLKAPDSFYELSIAQLNAMAVEQSLVSVDPGADRGTIQRQILTELNAQQRDIVITDNVMAVDILTEDDLFG